MSKIKELFASRKAWLTVVAIVTTIVSMKNGAMPTEEGLKLIAENIGYFVVALGLVDAAGKVKA